MKMGPLLRRGTVMPQSARRSNWQVRDPARRGVDIAEALRLRLVCKDLVEVSPSVQDANDLSDGVIYAIEDDMRIGGH
jgi:hypothetical protein